VADIRRYLHPVARGECDATIVGLEVQHRRAAQQQHELVVALVVPVALGRDLNRLEGLALVLVQRIALAVGAQADALAQMVEREQVLLPEVVERLQQDALLDLCA
jgi:hypothetical protein